MDVKCVTMIPRIRTGSVDCEGHPEDGDLPGAVARLMAAEKR